MNPLVLFHHPCNDGFAARVVAEKFLGPNAEYIGVNYDTKACPAGVKDREVYVLDFSFPAEEMIRIVDESSKLVWLDHHHTSLPILDSLVEARPTAGLKHHLFVDAENTRSGARLTWEFFSRGAGDNVPMLIRHVDDRDRWKFRLGGTKSFHRYLGTLPMEVGSWMPLLDREPPSIAYAIGNGIEQYMQEEVKLLLRKAVPCSIEARDKQGEIRKVKGLAVNCPVNQSEIGNQLAQVSGTYGLVYFIGSASKVFCSLRSVGDFDVSALAQAYGGGGHKNAAGFQTGLFSLEHFLRTGA